MTLAYLAALVHYKCKLFITMASDCQAISFIFTLYNNENKTKEFTEYINFHESKFFQCGNYNI
jgi:hypothetical protein